MRTELINDVRSFLENHPKVKSVMSFKEAEILTFDRGFVFNFDGTDFEIIIKGS